MNKVCKVLNCIRKSLFHPIIICIGLLVFPFIKTELHAQRVLSSPSGIGQDAYRFLYVKVTTNISTDNNASLPFKAKFGVLPYWSESFTIGSGTTNKIYYVVFDSESQWNNFSSNRMFSIHYICGVQEYSHFAKDLGIAGATGITLSYSSSYYQKPLSCNISQGPFTSNYTLEWGFSPPRPTSFSIKALKADGNPNVPDDWRPVGMVTENELIKFELTEPTYNSFNIDLNSDGDRWARLKTNAASGSTYIVKNIQSGASSQTFIFRARTYAGTNSIVGQSYGYIEMPLTVVSKPKFEVEPNYTVCEGGKLDSLVLTNISASPSIYMLKVQLYNKNNPSNILISYNINKTTTTYTINNPLAAGDYTVEVSNLFEDINGNPFPLGHHSVNISIDESTRPKLEQYFNKDIPIDCSYGQEVNLFNTNPNRPTNITIETCNSTYTNCTLIESPEKFTITPGTYYLKAYYNESPTCEENISVLVKKKYPTVDILENALLINYGCFGNPDTFRLKAGEYATEVGFDNYTIQYKIENSDYVSPDSPISSNGLSFSVSGKVTISIGVFDGDLKCEYSKEFDYTPRKPISFSVDKTDVKYCSDAENGKITLTDLLLEEEFYPGTVNLMKGNDTIQTKQWTTSTSPIEFKNLAVGNYTIELKDNTGCIYNTTENIAFTGTPFSITSVSTTDVSPCSDSKNGAIQVATEGDGSDSMQVSIDSDIWVKFNTISYLGKETYTVYARPGDLDACKVDTTATVNGPEPIILTTKITINPSCKGSNDGSIELEHTPFERTVTYQIFENDSWKDLIGNQANNLSSGVYKFRAIDNNNCMSSELEDTLTEPDQLAIILEPPVPPLCHGKNGTITFNCSGGTLGSSGYNFTITGNNGINISGSTFSNKTIELPSGDYTLKVVDANGCNATETFSIIDPTRIGFEYSLNNYNGYNIRCNGGVESMQIDLTGGTPFSDNSYKFTSPSYPDPVLGNQFIINNLKGDTLYTFTAEDENKCSETLNLILTQPDTLKFSIDNIVHPTCSGDSNGEIPVSVNGGVMPYKLFVNNYFRTDIENEGIYNLDSLKDGIYFLHLNDKNGCRFPKEDNAYEITTLSAPNPMSISIDKITMPTCHGKSDGSIEVSFSGRDKEDKFVELIQQAETIRGPYRIDSNTYTFSDLPTGSYSIKFTEESGICYVTKDTSINEPQQLYYSLTPTNVTCLNSNTGKVEVAVVGGNIPYIITLIDIDNDSTSVEIQNGESTSFVFENLYASVYGIILEDKHKCLATPQSVNEVTINNPSSALDLQLEQQPANCFETETGKIIASATGGWGEYKFSIDSLNWNGPFTEFTFNGLTSNSYQIFVQDSMNCVVEQSIIVEQPLKLIIDSIVVEPVSCNGGGNGTIEVFASGGNGGYQYNFGDGDFVNDSKQTQLISGDYSIIVKDSKGCETSQSVFVPEPPPFSLTIDKNTYNGGYNISCYGQSDTVWLTPSGATAPYSLAYDNGFFSDLAEDTQITIADLKADTYYRFTFTDNNDCKYIDSISLTEPDTLSITQINKTEPTCHNGSDGSIEVKGITGGAKGYTLTLDGHQTNYSKTVSTLSDYKFEGIKSDSTYILTITDSNGCSISRSLILDQPSPVIVEKIEVNHVMCKGDSTGSAVVKTVGGNGSYKYSWYNDNEELVSISNPLENQPAGSYKLMVTDNVGCQAINPETNGLHFSVTIKEPLNKLIITKIEATQQPTCFGGNEGSLSIASAGGWDQNHNYSLNDGPFIQNGIFSNLTSQSYSVRVSDKEGCIVEEEFYLTQPDSLELSTESIVNIDCHGNNNGEISLKAVGGNGDYVYGYKDSTQNISSSIKNLKAGNYSFWTEDRLGCTASLSTTISQPERISINSLIIQNPTCGLNNGSIEVQANGGIEPYGISWKNPVLPSTLQANNLSAGIYFFTLSDFNECSVDSTVILNSLNGPEIKVLSKIEPSCSYRNDGSIEILIEGDAAAESISWANSKNDIIGANQNLSNIGKGNYYVKVSDGNNCITSLGIALDAPNPITASITKTPVICADDATGSSTIDITGGTHPYSVNWFNTDNVTVAAGLEVQILSAGSYYASISDQNGCGLTSDANNITPVFHIDEPQQPLTLALEGIQKPTCFGGSNAQISLKAEGGWSSYSFAIEGKSPSHNPVIGNLASGEYVASVTDAFGCIVSLDITVADPLPVSISLLNQANVRCSGGNNGYISVSATNGLQPFNYSINNGATWNSHGAFNQLTNGNYTIIARDINQCANSIDVAVTQPESLVVSINSLSPSYCGSSNGFVALLPQGGVAPYKMQWDNQPISFDFTVDNLPLGSYVATIFDTNQCTTAIQVDIAEVEGPRITSHSVIAPKCHNSTDGALQFDLNGVSTPFTYFLNGASVESSDISDVPAGNYKFRVVDYFGCADSININLSAPEPISISLTDITHPLCFGYNTGSIISSAVGGTPPLDFEWSNGITSERLQNIGAGEYQLWVTDDNLCSDSVTVNIVNPEQMAIDLPKSISLCQGQVAVLDAQNPGSMYWWSSSNGLESFEREITVTQPGEYYLQVTNELGCFALDTVKIEFFDYTVNSTLLMPSAAMVGDTIVIIDISWPLPNAIEWIIPSEFTVLVDNPYDKQLIPNKEGLFSIGLISYTGECMAYSEKSVLVKGFAKPPLPNEKGYQNLIESVTLAPNPAQSFTTIDVILSDKADITIDLINGFGIKVKQVDLRGNHSYSHQMPLSGMLPGVYLVKVTALGTHRTVRLIVL